MEGQPHSDLTRPWLGSDGLTDLVLELGHEGYRVDGRHVGAALDLLVAAAARGEPVGDPQRAAALLGPLFCSNRSEQTAFDSRFGKFFATWNRSSQGLGRASDSREAAAAARRAIAARGERRERLARSTTGIATAAALIGAFWFVSLLGALIVGPVLWPSPAPATATGDETAQLLSTLLGADGVVPAATVILAVTFLPFVGVLLWRRISTRRFLRRAHLRGSPDISRIPIQGIGGRLFDAQSLIRLARSVRRHRHVMTSAWDVDATISSTIRRGGWLTPVAATRAVSPEYLVLIEQSGPEDHQARLAEMLIGLLAAQEVFVDTYWFRSDPRRVFAGDGTTRDLAELAARHGQHRLLIVSDGRCFLDPYTTSAWKWIDAFRVWDERVLWTPRPRASWDAEEAILKRHFLVLPFGSDPATQARPRRKGETDASLGDESVPMPETFRDRPQRWTSRSPLEPELLEPGLAALRIWLGHVGFRWLVACALYPRVSWPVTLYLGANVKAGDGQQLLQIDALTKLSRLPWMRRGHMPEWFRRRLRRELSGRMERSVRDVLNRMLVGTLSNRGEAFELELAGYGQGFLRRLMPNLVARLHKQAPPTSPLRDQLFVGFMRGREAGIGLPERILRLIGGKGDPSLAPEARLGAQLANAALAAVILCVGAMLLMPVVASFDAVARTMVIAAIILLPGFALGSASYHSVIVNRERPLWVPAFYWLGVPLFLCYGSRLLVESTATMSEQYPIQAYLILTIPFSFVVGRLVYSLLRAGQKYRRVDDARILRKGYQLVEFWSRPTHLLLLPALAALLIWLVGEAMLGLSSLDQRFMLYSLLVMTSSASFALMTGALHLRRTDMLGLGSFFQIPTLLVFAWLFAREVLGDHSRAGSEFTFSALVGYVAVGSLLAQGWRQAILRRQAFG